MEKGKSSQIFTNSSHHVHGEGFLVQILSSAVVMGNVTRIKSAQSNYTGSTKKVKNIYLPSKELGVGNDRGNSNCSGSIYFGCQNITCWL